MILETLQGSQVLDVVDDVAQLRIAVFREYPYLYDGSLDYEKRYLEALSRSVMGVVVVARDLDNIVGASTALPLADAESTFQKPFIDVDENPKDYFYYAESVLLPEYRSKGIGRAFFHHRELAARQLGGFKRLCFCAVERPENHPKRPPNYRSLEPLWESEGFHHRPDLHTLYPWTDLGDSKETEKPMTFWVKEL